MFESMLNTASSVGQAMPYFVNVFTMLLTGWIVYDKLTSYSFDEELVKKDNPAIGASLSGYIIGLAIGMKGALHGAENTLMGHGMVAASCLIVVILVSFSATITDLLVLSKFKIKKELLEDRNDGTGFVVAANYIAAGLVINGAMTGESESILTGIRDIFVYWAVGQVFVILGGFVYQGITRYCLHEEIGKRDNAAAGLAFGGFLVALSYIIRASIMNASSDIMVEIAVTVVLAIAGMLLLISGRVIADKVFMPGSPLCDEVGRQKNIGAARIVVASYLAVAILFTASIATMESTLKNAVETPQEEVVETNQQANN